MAVPTFSSITPSVGHTGGRVAVDIAGTNFRLPPALPPTGFVGGKPLVTVEVEFDTGAGAELATDIAVVSTSRIVCLTPEHDPGDVDITIRNLDDNGVPIAGETVTAVGAYTFSRPTLDDTVQSDLLRSVVEVIKLWRRQILENTNLTVHTDFDPETGDMLNFIEVAELPSVELIGPELIENRLHSLNARPEDLADPTNTKIKREPRTVDMTFSWVAVSTHTKQILNMMQAIETMFRRTKFLRVEAVPGDKTTRIDYEMDLIKTVPHRVISRRNNSNLRASTGQFVIKGVDIDGLPGFTDDLVVGLSATVLDVILEPTINIGQSFPIGKSPG